jgi:hypothetical protein
MSVENEHPEYSEYKNQWTKCRDCYAGQDTIHGKGIAYLAKLDGQSNDDYKAYVKRSVFYGATGRTVDGLKGMIFRKPPMVELPQIIEEYSADITLTGVSLLGLAEECVYECLLTGRFGLLVDYPDIQTVEGLTVAEAQALGIRPFIKLYPAESITNWKVAANGTSRVLTQVRLLEYVAEPTDEFDDTTVKQYRVLDIFNGAYRQRIFRLNRATGKWDQFDDDIFPQINGRNLDYIPFVFGGVKNSDAGVDKPPLIDLVNVNLSHYMTTADLEHGSHYTALPTAVIAGVVESGDKAPEYRIGSATAWAFPDPNTKAFYLEFQGQGLKSLADRLETKESYMAFLGSRMLSPEKRAAEAAETASIHRQGEISVLSAMSYAISASITEALKILAEWAGVSGEIEYQLNTDFVPNSMTAQDLQALVMTWQAGGMAFDDLIHNLKQGEIIRLGREAQDIKQEVADENPFMSENV